jgi:hypothetical protein
MKLGLLKEVMLEYAKALRVAHPNRNSLILQSLEATLRNIRFNIKKFYVVTTKCICVLCMVLRKKSGDYFSIQY